MRRVARTLLAALCLLWSGTPWAAAPASPGAASRGASPLAKPPANEAARFCRPFRFVAYSTLEPSGRKVEESFAWNAAQQAYLIKGPVLAFMLNDPGVRRLPGQAELAGTTFRIAMRAQLSSPVDRFCEYGFQESAHCDAHGNIFYSQLYTGCDLQTLQHVVRLTPDNAGTLQLLDISFEDVQGVFGNPLYLSADSDLRLRVRQ